MRNINELSRRIQQLCKVAPNTQKYHMEDVHRAGGVMAILGELDRAGLLHNDIPMVHSATVSEALAQWDIVQTSDEAVKTFYLAGPAGIRTTRKHSARIIVGKRWMLIVRMAAHLSMPSVLRVALLFFMATLLNVKPSPLCSNIAIKLMSLVLKKRSSIWQVVVSGIQAGFWASTKKTVINTLKKKEDGLVQVNPNIQKMELATGTIIRVGPVCQEAEIDEQWSYVFKKSNQPWLWYAIDHSTNTVLAYVFGKRNKDEVFKKLKKLLEPFGIKKFYTDDWGTYDRHLEENTHLVGKKNTQKIERKNLNFRTWIKRLAERQYAFQS